MFAHDLPAAVIAPAALGRRWSAVPLVRRGAVVAAGCAVGGQARADGRPTTTSSSPRAASCTSTGCVELPRRRRRGRRRAGRRRPGPSLVESGEAGAYYYLSTGRMPLAEQRGAAGPRKQPAYDRRARSTPSSPTSPRSATGPAIPDGRPRRRRPGRAAASCSGPTARRATAPRAAAARSATAGRAPPLSDATPDRRSPRRSASARARCRCSAPTLIDDRDVERHRPLRRVPPGARRSRRPPARAHRPDPRGLRGPGWSAWAALLALVAWIGAGSPSAATSPAGRP